MKKGKLIPYVVLAVLSFPRHGHTQGVQSGAPPTGSLQRPPSDMDSVFLAEADIAEVKRILPGLAEASQRGPKETTAYLATLDIPFDRITQILTNISVAYSSIKFEEWMRELKPKLDTGKPSTYRQRVEEGEHQLDTITAPYRNAKRGGKTALDVNREIVRKNLPDVEALLSRMTGMKASSMPFRQ